MKFGSISSGRPQKIEMWKSYGRINGNQVNNICWLWSMCVCINMDYMANSQPSEGSRQNIHNYACVSLSLTCEYKASHSHCVAKSHRHTRAYDRQKQTVAHPFCHTVQVHVRHNVPVVTFFRCHVGWKKKKERRPASHHRGAHRPCSVHSHRHGNATGMNGSEWRKSRMPQWQRTHKNPTREICTYGSTDRLTDWVTDWMQGEKNAVKFSVSLQQKKKSETSQAERTEGEKKKKWFRI